MAYLCVYDTISVKIIFRYLHVFDFFGVITTSQNLSSEKKIFDIYKKMIFLDSEV